MYGVQQFLLITDVKNCLLVCYIKMYKLKYAKLQLLFFMGMKLRLDRRTCVMHGRNVHIILVGKS
jgi:hypothetical protein